MRILLDECIPKKFKARFAGHDCSTVPEAGLAGKKNGELLFLAERRGFEVFLSLDKGILYQQNLSGRRIAILVLRASSNRLIDILPHTAACLSTLRLVRPGQVIIIGGS